MNNAIILLKIMVSKQEMMQTIKLKAKSKMHLVMILRIQFMKKLRKLGIPLPKMGNQLRSKQNQIIPATMVMNMASIIIIINW